MLPQQNLKMPETPSHPSSKIDLSGCWTQKGLQNLKTKNEGEPPKISYTFWTRIDYMLKILVSKSHFGVRFALRGDIPLRYWNPKSLGGEKIGPFICHWYSGQSLETDLQLFNRKQPIKRTQFFLIVWFLKIYISVTSHPTGNMKRCWASILHSTGLASRSCRHGANRPNIYNFQKNFKTRHLAFEKVI